MPSKKTIEIPNRPKYAIVNDFDAPEPSMVCQWVPDVGYCYLDRKNKASYDGMQGNEATPVEAFGIVSCDNADGTVSFYGPSEVAPTATYQDGEPRSWQSSVMCFERQQLKPNEIKKAKESA